MNGIAVWLSASDDKTDVMHRTCHFLCYCCVYGRPLDHMRCRFDDSKSVSKQTNLNAANTHNFQRIKVYWRAYRRIRHCDYPVCLCPCVCLSVCAQDNSRARWWMSTKLVDMSKEWLCRSDQAECWCWSDSRCGSRITFPLPLTLQTKKRTNRRTDKQMDIAIAQSPLRRGLNKGRGYF